MIDDICRKNKEIAVLRDDYLDLQNQLNALYWPRLAYVNKKLKDYKWYLLLSLCLLISVLIAVFSNIIRNEYLIGGAIGLSALLFIFLCIVVKRFNKKKFLINESWEKEKKPLYEKKEELDKLLEESVKDMIDVITSKYGSKIIDEIGTGYDDLLQQFEAMLDE